MSFMQFIQELTGAPNDAKWNSVLFGGIRQKNDFSLCFLLTEIF